MRCCPGLSTHSSLPPSLPPYLGELVRVCCLEELGREFDEPLRIDCHDVAHVFPVGREGGREGGVSL